MNKTLFSFLVLMFFCFSLTVNAADNPYNTYFDHSELDWYISQNTGPDEAAQCLYYDYFADSEEAILIAQRPTSSGIDVIYIHCCNAGVFDWYQYYNIVLEATGVERAGYTSDGRDILKYTFLNKGKPIYLFLTKTNDGLLDKIMLAYDEDTSVFTWREYQEFIYSNDGSLLQTNMGSATYAGLFFDYDANSKYVDEAFCFSYNPDKSLSQLDHYYLEEGESNDRLAGEAVFIYDDNGARTSIQSSMEADRGRTDEISFLRDSAGHVLIGQSTHEGEQRSISISYSPDGQTKYNNGWEE